MDVREYLEKMGLPGRDNYELPTSNKKFPDGAHFRTEELPMTAAQYEKMFSLSSKYGFTVNRITDVKGIMFDTDEEIIRKLEIARENGCEVIMGPGAGEYPFDISQQTEAGVLAAGKLRGMDNISNVIKSMMRGVQLGCRGFIFYDEGALNIALKMRKEGKLPPETKFKLSAIFSIANAAAFKFWTGILEPQDDINPVRDLTLPMIASLRQIADHALNIHIFWRTKIARTMEVPEIIRISSPVYLKNARFGPEVTFEDRCLQGFRIVEIARKEFPEFKQSGPGAKGLSVPAKPESKWK